MPTLLLFNLSFITTRRKSFISSPTLSFFRCSNLVVLESCLTFIISFVLESACPSIRSPSISASTRLHLSWGPPSLLSRRLAIRITERYNTPRSISGFLGESRFPPSPIHLELLYQIHLRLRIMPNVLRKPHVNMDEAAAYKSPPRYAWEFCPEDVRRATNRSKHPHPLRSCQVPHSPKPHSHPRSQPHHLETIDEEQSRSSKLRSYSLSSEYTEASSSTSPPYSHWSSPPSSVPESPPKPMRIKAESKFAKLSWFNRSPKANDTKWTPRRQGSESSDEETPRETQLAFSDRKVTQKVRFYVPVSPKSTRYPKSPHPFGSSETPSALSRAAAYLPEDTSDLVPPAYQFPRATEDTSNDFHVDFPVQALPPHGAVGAEESDRAETELIGYSALEPSPMVSPASTFRGSEFSPVSPASVSHTRRSSLDSPTYAYKRKGSVGLDSPAFHLPSPVDSNGSLQQSPRTAQQLQQEKEWIWRLKETNVASKAKVAKAKEVDVAHHRSRSIGLGILVAKPGTGETEFKAFPSPGVKSPMWEAIAKRVGEAESSSAE